MIKSRGLEKNGRGLIHFDKKEFELLKKILKREQDNG